MPAGEFALSETLDQLSEMVFTIDRVVARDTDHVMPFVWAAEGDFETLTTALESDPSVANVKLLANLEEERLYRMEWVDKSQIIGYMLLEEDATVQRATAHDEQWTLRVLFPERKGISTTSQYAKEHGFTLNVSRIYDADRAQRVRYELTEDQRTALVTALEHGYYEVPRAIDQSSLADNLGISHQAMSERLRRGTEGIIREVLSDSSLKEDRDRSL
ncbi:helix-turn-helix domain-containing protein [Halomicrococcus sp. SG-WS-1]|uniref:helix-turn-helix domain-containing protein n=1 Tax=Halomicrococcus sp. SG-WS-1 TaxID=3439057 RepID=UPI003F7A5A1F